MEDDYTPDVNDMSFMYVFAANKLCSQSGYDYEAEFRRGLAVIRATALVEAADAEWFKAGQTPIQWANSLRARAQRILEEEGIV